MVSTPELSDETRACVAAQLGPALGALTAVAPLEGQPALGESLPILLLTEEAILDPDGGPLGRRVLDQGRWHHQIYVGDAVPAYARSETPDGGDQPVELAEISHSSLAGDIRAAMAWIDENVPDEGIARLIMAPSHQVAALWLDGPGLDHVLVLSAPRWIEEFITKRPVEQRTFIEALSRTPAIPGMGLRIDLEGEE
ncbi:MAG: hypothetical protein PGN23_07250 [Sphingomonas adhaesiva]|uniref:hypothetical protein n=1 Tax=Sphingomonas adhaesiva TaxID=28212 RepID=UPI002FF5F38C